MRNVALIVGSLRQGAYSRLVAQALIELAPPTLQLNEVAIGELPFYNQDLETDTPPAPWRTFRDHIRKSDGVVFVTPEYNRGMPGVVKNAIDVGTRPPKESVWRGKPALVISQTPGKLGGMAGHQQLAGDAGARSLHSGGGQAVRPRRQTHRRRHTQTLELGARGLRHLDRTLPVEAQSISGA
jgi:NAD(P)H-dependent FMN reductase